MANMANDTNSKSGLDWWVTDGNEQEIDTESEAFEDFLSRVVTPERPFIADIRVRKTSRGIVTSFITTVR